MSSAGPYGSTSGTSQGPATMSQSTTVTKIDAYYTSAYVYGLRLHWGGSSYLFGEENGVTADEFDLTDDPVKEIKYVTSGGIIRGIKFKTVDNRTLETGLTPATSTAFSDSDYEFTDMVSYKGTVNSTVVIWGATFYYVDTGSRRALPNPRAFLSEMALPSLAVMVHACVVVKSFMEVGKLRASLSIKAPSCDPPLTTSPSNAQLWYRTFRAQENCKEMFLVYLPSILIASSMGYQVFGKWAPRAVGALALLGAFFRHKYLNAYIEDADKRGKPFYYAGLSMKPIFYLAIASSGYLVGKELYHTIRGHSKKSSTVEEQEEEKHE